MIRIFSTNKNKKDMIKQNNKFRIIRNKDQIIIFILGKINNKRPLFLVCKKERQNNRKNFSKKKKYKIQLNSKFIFKL